MNKKRLTAIACIAYIGQLGLSLIVPIVGCAAGAAWIVGRYSLSSAWTLAGIFLGVGTSAVTFVKFAKEVQNSAESEDVR